MSTMLYLTRTVRKGIPNMSKITDDEPKYKCTTCDRKFYQVTIHGCGIEADWENIEDDDE